MKRRKFNYLVIEEEVIFKNEIRNSTRLRVRCICGKVLIIQKSKYDWYSSCGCKPGFRTHELSKTPTYKIWAAMVQKCTNKKNVHYKKDIKLCRKWKNYVGFLKDMGERPSVDHYLRRKDNTLGFEKSNCIWGVRVRRINKE